MKLSILACLLLVLSALANPVQDRTPTWEAVRRRFDADGDGKVTAAEFTRNRNVFRRLDKNGDGALTEEDFASAPKPAEPPAAAKPEAVEFFEKKVRPILAGVCSDCHSSSAPKLRGGLRVDSRETLLAGGNSGAAIVPGDADASLLVQAVRYTDEDLQMPPK